MPDDVIQRLGFDVSDGLKNLEKFGKALSSTSTRLTTLAKKIDSLNRSSAGMNIGRYVGPTDQLSVALERADKRVGRLTTSVELLSRIVYTQLVIKGLRIAETAMVDASSRAAELQNKLADISTISGKTFNGLNDIGSATEGLSRQLGIDQLQVANGLYEAIGNQVAGTKKELIDFNRVSGQFAIGTLTDQIDSVKLLSGTLNAYGYDVTRAEEVASKFNKSIELGAISGKDFSSQIGRVIPQAALLGVSLEEVLSAFSVMTRNGLSASESATRLGGVITSLQKPSKKLSEVLANLNVTSGESLVRSVGFAGALQEIAKQTDGSSAEIAKLFPNVRGLAGELILGSQKATEFASDLKEVQGTLTSLNKERFEIVSSTDAKRVEKELNAIRIETTKLGAELLHGTAEAFKFVGGADNIISAAKIAAPAILAMATSTGIFAANSRLAALNGTKLGAILGRAGSIGALVGAAISLGDFIGSKVDSSRFSALKKLEDANAKANEAFIAGEQERLSAAREADNEIVQSALNAARQQIATFKATNDSLLLDEKRLVSEASSQLNRFVSVREGYARQLEQASQDSVQAIQASQRRVGDLNLSKDQRRFDARLKIVDDPGKLDLLVSRVTQLSRSARQSLSSAVTDQDISQALKLFDIAERTGDSAQTIADRLGQEGRVLSTLNKLTQDRIRAEQRLQSLQDQRGKRASEEAEKQRRINDEIKAATQQVIANLPTIGATDQEARQKALTDAMQRLNNAGLKSADFKLADALGLAKLSADLTAPINFDPQKGITQIQTKLQEAFDEFKVTVNFDVSGLEKTLGQKLRTPDEVAAALTKAKEEADQLRLSQSKISQERSTAPGLRSEIRSLLSQDNTVSRASGAALGIAPADVERGIALIRDFDTEARKLAIDSDLTRDKVSKLFEKVRELQTIQEGAGFSILGQGGGFAPDIENLSMITERLIKLSQLPSFDPNQEARLKKLESLIPSRLGSIAGEAVRSLTFTPDVRTKADRLPQQGVTNVGGITININESANSKETAREVINLINREQRRGTSRVQ